jgi:malonyl-CoA O-methyltransferase
MPEAILPEKRAVRRAFERAAEGYERSAALQREVGARLLAHLDPMRVAPARLLDLGSGPGAFFEPLAKRFADAEIVAIDLAFNMLRVAQRRTPWWRRALVARAPRLICADAERLPLRGASAQLVFSNLALQWCAPAAVFAECARVLETGGLMLFSTFGPDTLKELRSAFSAVDAHPHVGRFTDMHDIGDLLVHSGFADPVMQMEMLTLTYDDARAMAHDLKAIGATNATVGRRRGLTGRRRFERALAALDAMPGRAPDGRIPATFEVIYGHAWKVAPRRTPEGHAIVTFAR